MSRLHSSVARFAALALLLLISLSTVAQTAPRVEPPAPRPILLTDADSPGALLSTLLTRFPSSTVLDQLPVDPTNVGKTFVVAIGHGPMKIACAQTKYQHVIVVGMSSIDFATNASNCALKTISAVYADASPMAQLELVAAIFGARCNIVVFTSDASKFTEPAIAGTARAMNLNISVERVKDNIPVFRLLNSHPTADVLLAIPDRSIYTPVNVRLLLEATYRRSKPMIGFNVSTVQAGMLAAAYASTEDIAETVEEMAKKFFVQHEMSPPMHVRQWHVAINESVARSLNIDIPARVRELGRSRESKTP
jgi:ABC-type uncharacterized transport system substrate-binding protein